MKFLAGYEGKVRGVDSVDGGADVIKACTSLAQKYTTVVAATGKTDIITDGSRTCIIENDSSMLTMITGTGCMVGALVAAAAVICEDKFISTAAAIMATNSLQGVLLPGTFRMKLFDYIYNMTKEDIMNGGKIRCT